MPESEAPRAKGIGGFLKAQTGPLPNWAWALVVVGGVAAAILIPKFFGKSGTTDQTAQDQSGNQGLGLAIDPTTGLPYAVEGLVPSGATVGTAPGNLPPMPTPTPTPVPTPTPTPTPEPVPGPTSTLKYNPNEPLIPFGKYNGPNFSNLTWGTKYTYNGTMFQLGTGADGRLYGVPVSTPGTTYTQAQWNAIPLAPGKKALLYEPQSAYPYPSSTQVYNSWSNTRETRVA